MKAVNLTLDVGELEHLMRLIDFRVGALRTEQSGRLLPLHPLPEEVDAHLQGLINEAVNLTKLKDKLQKALKR